jgi:cobalt-zinc-cadmium efflux system protein
MSPQHQSTDNIKIAFLLNFFFTIIEVVGGLWTNSVAILADALHDLGDTVALGLSWYFAKISQKKRDNQFSYGYKRFSLLGALISSLILVVGSTLILVEVIPRLINPANVKVEGMMLLAILGVITNGAAALRLQQGQTQNERIVMLHLLEDVLGWVAVLITSLVMLVVKLPVLDPILSMLITSYILWNVVKNLRETVNVFLQAIPSTLNKQQLEAALMEQLPIYSIHDWHLWSMDGEYHVVSCHVVVAPHLSVAEIITIKKQVRKILNQYNIQHLTIEIEYEHEVCELENC